MVLQAGTAETVVLAGATRKEVGGWLEAGRRRTPWVCSFQILLKQENRFREPLACCLIFSVSSNYITCDFHFIAYLNIVPLYLI